MHLAQYLITVYIYMLDLIDVSYFIYNFVFVYF